MIQKTKTINSLILCLFAISLWSCQKDTNYLEAVEKSDGLPTISITAENDRERMYEDGESISEMTSESRRFRIAQLVRIKAINKDSIEVSNFTPVNIENIVVTMTKGDGTIIDLLKIESLGAFVNKRIPVSMNLANDSDLKLAKFDYKGNSIIIDKFKQISKILWEIKPHDFDPNRNHSSWEDSPSAKKFRIAIGAMINVAYVSSKLELLDQMKKDTLFDNDGITLISNEQKEKDYNRLLSTKTLNIGILDENGGTYGLGGGSTYGIMASIFKQSYFSNPGETLGHEFGHVLGYSHGSNMTYSKIINGKRYGFGLSFKNLWNDLIALGELPITESNYFIPEDLKNAF